jgi:branched-chain amino acid transport system substrate-binding protein
MSTMTRTPIARRVAAIPLVAIAIAVAGCGNGPTTDLPVTPTTTAASAALGPLNRATKDPVKVGWVGIGLSDDTSGSTLAATAVAGYANAYLGGLAGHSIKVVPCEDHGTTDGGRACGDEFVREGVVAVALGSSSQIDSVLAATSHAGIPVMVNLSGTDTVLHTPGVFALRNPLSFFGTAAGFARDKKLTSAAVLTPDVPAAADPARTLAPPLFANAGATATVLPIGIDVQDMAPQIDGLEKNDPAMWLVLGDAAFCTSAITGIHKVGSKAPIVSADQCIGQDRGAAIPGGLDGVTVIAQAVLDPNAPETALFNAVRSTYGEGVGSGAETVGGYQAMLSLVRAIDANPPAQLTAATATTAIGQAPATPYPLGGGSTFRCDGKAVPQISANICSASGIIADAGADGSLSDYRPVDTTGIYKLG